MGVKYVDRDRRGAAADGKSILVDVFGTHRRVSLDDSSLWNNEELFRQCAGILLKNNGDFF